MAVFPARHHEQRVREPVQVGDHERADRLLAGQRDGQALGAAADGARDVQVRGAGRSRRAG